MKKLWIIRHAKSDWNTGVRDFDRPLNKRGLKDAPAMGQELKRKFEKPQLMLSSPANRAISTARLIANEIGYSLEKIQQEEAMYHASPKDLLRVIWKVPKEVDTLFIYGHNPGLSDLVTYLTGKDTELKTCCVAVLEVPFDDWNALVSETCDLKEYLLPREI